MNIFPVFDEVELYLISEALEAFASFLHPELYVRDTMCLLKSKKEFAYSLSSQIKNFLSSSDDSESDFDDESDDDCSYGVDDSEV